MYTRRLRLDSLVNARDLGGYAADGGVTRYGVFVRSEMPVNLTERDRNTLKNYGIRTSVDLRQTKEIRKRASQFAFEKWVRYVHLSAYPEEPTGMVWENTEEYEPGFSWHFAYIRLIEEGKGWIKDILELAAECEGAMHFHCFTGKDRTGVLAAMLLDIAGVCREDIAADYSLSQSLLDPFYAAQFPHFSKTDRDRNLEDKFLFTSPTNMFRFLDYVYEKYGGVSGLAYHCGVSKETLRKIRDKFVEKD